MPNDAPDWVRVTQDQLVGRGPNFTPLGDTTSPSLNKDTISETISGSSAVSTLSAAMASIKAATGSTIALRGSAGAFTRGSNNSVSPAFGQATQAGNLLVAFVTQDGSGQISTTAPGWFERSSSYPGGRPIVEVWTRENCGASETAPVFTTTGGTNPMNAQLLEFTEAATSSSTDQIHSQASSSSSATQTNTLPAADAAFGDLVLSAMGWGLAAPSTASWSDVLNNGATAVQVGSTGSLSIDRHANFVYGIIPAATAAQPLGVAPWVYDADGVSTPAAGSQASVVLAGVAGKRYVLAMIDGSILATTATLSNKYLQGVDGSTAIYSHGLAIPATAGANSHWGESGLAFPGTTGNSMTGQMNAATANVIESVTIGAYLR